MFVRVNTNVLFLCWVRFLGMCSNVINQCIILSQHIGVICLAMFNTFVFNIIYELVHCHFLPRATRPEPCGDCTSLQLLVVTDQRIGSMPARQETVLRDRNGSAIAAESCRQKIPQESRITGRHCAAFSAGGDSQQTSSKFRWQRKLLWPPDFRQ